jgi:WD repeat-containing protein 70
MDDTMKLWDIRKRETPIFTWKDLTNLSSKTAICISPNETMVLTGTSVRKGFGYGHIMAYDVASGLL